VDDDKLSCTIAVADNNKIIFDALACQQWERCKRRCILGK